MKITILFLLSAILFVSCGPSPYVQPVMVQPAVVQQQQIAQQQDGYSPYQVYDNNGSQVVLYTDPYLHTSYYLEYAMFMSLLNSGGYGGIHSYYLGHRSYIDGYYNRYHTTYHHVYYDSRSDGGARFRRSVPSGSYSNSTRSNVTRPSAPPGRPISSSSPSTSTRSSAPTGRSTMSTPTRSSMPTSSRSSSPSSSRSSAPSGRRH